MNKDYFSHFFPYILGLALVIIKSFVLIIMIVITAMLTSAPAQTASVLPNVILPEILPTQTSTISPEDAAIANSEWSGAITIKTPLPVGTPVVIPTIQPTVIPVKVTAANPEPKPTAIINASISSPLQGFGIGDLQDLISQEFKLPPPGEDSGHHGVDFAFWNRDNKPILGDPIQSVFPGKVSMSDSKEKAPYGFAILIETPLNSVPPNLIQAIKIPTQPLGTIINNKLNCPDLTKDQWNTASKSLYTLYGHMISPSSLKQGDAVSSGQVIGFVGNSGYSSAPHLHLEMRIGPSGATFSNMGHYDGNTTEEDRHNYCNWRVSGVFQMFNPMDIFRSSLASK